MTSRPMNSRRDLGRRCDIFFLLAIWGRRFVFSRSANRLERCTGFYPIDAAPTRFVARKRSGRPTSADELCARTTCQWRRLPRRRLAGRGSPARWLSDNICVPTMNCAACWRCISFTNHFQNLLSIMVALKVPISYSLAWLCRITLGIKRCSIESRFQIMHSMGSIQRYSHQCAVTLGRLSRQREVAA